MPGAATVQILLLLLSAAAAVGLGGDSDRVGTAGAATRTERCEAQRTTSGIGVHDAKAPPEGLPESDPVASGDPRDCPSGRAAADDGDRHLLHHLDAPSGPPRIWDYYSVSGSRGDLPT